MEQEGAKTRRIEDGSEEIIGACIEVHRHLGPGLLESAYEEWLAHELSLRGLRSERQRAVPLRYEGDLACVYRLDLVVTDSVIVEVKAVERLLPVYEARVITYLKADASPGCAGRELRRTRATPMPPKVRPAARFPFAPSRLPVIPTQ